MIWKTCSTTSPLGTVWSSLISPIKKFWDIAPVHLSTYYGESNRHGRPGPVLVVLIERNNALRCRTIGKGKKHQQRLVSTMSHDTLMTSSNVSMESTRLSDELEVYPSRALVNSSGTSISYSHCLDEATYPEIHALVIVTPRALERYLLNGLLVKRIIPPDNITCCVPSVISGVGRALVCGTQLGRVYIFDTARFDVKLMFDPVCLDKHFITEFYRLYTPSSSSNPLLAFKHGKLVDTNGTDVYTNSPYLVSTFFLKWFIDTICRRPRVSSVWSLTKKGDADEMQEDGGGETHITGYSSMEISSLRNAHDFLLSDNLLCCYGTTTGAGMTLTLLEARTSEFSHLREAYRQGVYLQKKHDMVNSIQKTDQTKDIMETVNPNANLHLSKSQLNDEHKVDSDYYTETQNLPLFQSFQNLLLSRHEMCKVFVVCSFECFGDALVAGDAHGQIFIWSVPSGCLRRVLSCPTVLDDNTLESYGLGVEDREKLKAAHLQTRLHVSALLGVHIKDVENHIWAGFGNGLVVVYDLQAGSIMDILHEGSELRLFECLPRVGILLSLNECCTVTCWNYCNRQRILTLTYGQLTGGLSITCLKTVESEKHTRGFYQASLILGCVDGSIFIHRLFWEDAPSSYNQTSANGCLPSHAVNECDDNEPPSVLSDVSIPFSTKCTPRRVLQCLFLQSFTRDVEPCCPICSFWVDPVLDVLLIGDASGIVATLSPIRKVLENIDANVTQDQCLSERAR